MIFITIFTNKYNLYFDAPSGSSQTGFYRYSSTRNGGSPCWFKSIAFDKNFNTLLTVKATGVLETFGLQIENFNRQLSVQISNLSNPNLIIGASPQGTKYYPIAPSSSYKLDVLFDDVEYNFFVNDVFICKRLSVNQNTVTSNQIGLLVSGKTTGYTFDLYDLKAFKFSK
jgi:hypothetical protein